MLINAIVQFCGILKRDKQIKVLIDSEHKSLPTIDLRKRTPRQACANLVQVLFGMSPAYLVLVEDGFVYEQNLAPEKNAWGGKVNEVTNRINLIYSYSFYEELPCSASTYQWVNLDEIIKLRPLRGPTWEIIQKCLNGMNNDSGYDAFYEALENSPGVA